MAWLCTYLECSTSTGWLALIGNNVSRSRPGHCSHDWVEHFNGKCPYGWAGPGDVTWPDYDRASRRGAPLEEAKTDSKVVIGSCIFFSYIPYIAAIVVAVELLRRRGTRELNLLLFAGIVPGINELCVKPFVEQPRPELSCIQTCGMPSSHAAMAMGFLVLCVSDFVRRVHLHEEESTTQERRNMRTSVEGRQLGNVKKWICRWCLPTDIYFDELGVSQAIFYSLLCMLAYLPVPRCRVELSDHTDSQMWIGIWVGVSLALTWLFVVRMLQHRTNHLLGEPLPVVRVLKHNFPLPCSVAMRRCQRHGPCPCKSRAPVRELQWYLKQTDARLAWLHSVDIGYAVHEVGYLEARRNDLIQTIHTLESPHSSELPHSTGASGEIPCQPA